MTREVRIAQHEFEALEGGREHFVVVKDEDYYQWETVRLMAGWDLLLNEEGGPMLRAEMLGRIVNIYRGEGMAVGYAVLGLDLNRISAKTTDP